MAVNDGNTGVRVIAGIDEAGRGPLAGPVVAAAVILDPDHPVEGLADSKKLTARKRDLLFDLLSDAVLAIGIGIAQRREIDQRNILQATIIAMQRAVDALKIKPDHLMIDGQHIALIHPSQETVVGGDQSVPAISAASIIAKVTRDRLMQQYHRVFPEYGFQQHKGYGTPGHLSALKELGATPIHRQSFRPVRDYLPRWGDLKDGAAKGRLAEQLAAVYLIEQGMGIREMNYNAAFAGELDIIADDGPEIVFCEVKARSGSQWGAPEDQITVTKRDRIMAAANAYCQEKDIDTDVRFDVISVRFTKEGPRIRHIKDGIYAD
ncbi:MAG: ribonuclease HII [Candidatus Marinimicrobia bacterium]|nr:ribonuclease HII [Candidatus Neomarinimicrobiota bacterium]